MAKIIIDSSLHRHPKFIGLMGRLNVGKRDLLWMLWSLWGWVADYYPDGNLVDVSEASLAQAMDFQREPKAVAQALQETGFLDSIPGGWHIHDWEGWRSDSVRSRERRSPLVKRPAFDRNPTSSVQSSSNAVEDVVLVFETTGKTKTWELTTNHLKKWEGMFPGVNLLLEARKAKGWFDANPTKRRTTAGILAFLFRWMERAQNNPRGPASATNARKSVYDVEENTRIEQSQKEQKERVNRILGR